MKKIMAIITIMMLVMPLTMVKAINDPNCNENGSCFEYKRGDEVNFYTHEGDTTGTRTIILEDLGKTDKYVKVWATGYSYDHSLPYCEAIDGDCTVFTNMPGYKGGGTAPGLLGSINANAAGFAYAKPIQEEGNLTLITLNDLIDLFGATKDGDKYTIDVATWGSTMASFETQKEGLYTQTVEKEGDNYYVWVLKFPKNENREVTSITIERELTSSATTYAYVPVVYLDKTYDCVDRESKEDYSCYSCDDEYRWLTVGTQPESCTLVEDITRESACVKSPKTGVEDYILEFVIIASICGVALYLVKKKDLFRGI